LILPYNIRGLRCRLDFDWTAINDHLVDFLEAKLITAHSTCPLETFLFFEYDECFFGSADLFFIL